MALYVEKGDTKFQRAACRWLSRLTAERETLTLLEAQFAAAALVALPARAHAAASLRSLLE